jgi:hypothetical protein
MGIGSLLITEAVLVRDWPFSLKKMRGMPPLFQKQMERAGSFVSWLRETISSRSTLYLSP